MAAHDARPLAADFAHGLCDLPKAVACWRRTVAAGLAQLLCHRQAHRTPCTAQVATARGLVPRTMWRRSPPSGDVSGSVTTANFF
ncbi:vacuolar protein sorting-associated protein 8 [Dorcoceras hygrometricum]|uniref:Vacuolar protein sorting-associated protein 8 n=1 Tax=Dorcoceras hygrometricum TaxID=472368 RepID=A0A2Z7A1C9_9LAMI|nr:vacuolar protein sorting-associated protein 8 [Dorcoceras hygrometricum]